jgi:hypothetical protein
MGEDTDAMTGRGFRAMARTILDVILHVRFDYIEHPDFSSRGHSLELSM